VPAKVMGYPTNPQCHNTDTDFLTEQKLATRHYSNHTKRPNSRRKVTCRTTLIEHMLFTLWLSNNRMCFRFTSPESSCTAGMKYHGSLPPLWWSRPIWKPQLTQQRWETCFSIEVVELLAMLIGSVLTPDVIKKWGKKDFSCEEQLSWVS